MKAKLNIFIPVLAALIFSTVIPQFSNALAQGTTAFTYQGRLNTGTNRANGGYDMTFAVFDANVAGNLIAGPITNSSVAVSNGLFTVSLDFGPGVFTGTNYWVQMAVSPAGAGTFSTLVPRQQLTPAPYAISLISPQSYALCPPGSVMAYLGTNAPPGWLLCNGAVVPVSQYPALYAVIGTSSGNGNGSSTTFNLPDMRGVFLRGVDNGRGLDPDVNTRTAPYSGANTNGGVGSYEADAFQAHHHLEMWAANNRSGIIGLPFYAGQGDTLTGSYGSGLGQPLDADTDGIHGTPRTGYETRPVNIYVNYIIKY